MNDKINVQGTAIKVGVSKNQIRYTSEELNNFNKSFKGRPILKDHNSTVDGTIGLVTSSNFENNKVTYTGWVKDDGNNLIEKIIDGRAKEVSVGGYAKQIVQSEADEEEGIYEVVGLEAMELSITPTPAVKGTSLQLALENIKEGKKTVLINESFSHNINNCDKKNTEVKIMTEQEKEPVKEPIVEPTEEPVVEPTKEPEAETVADEVPAKENIKHTFEVDTSKLDEALEKAKELALLQEKLNKKVEEKTLTKENNLKGKISTPEPIVEEENSEFVVENTEYAAGNSLWKQTNADGTYKVGDGE